MDRKVRFQSSMQKAVFPSVSPWEACVEDVGQTSRGMFVCAALDTLQNNVPMTNKDVLPSSPTVRHSDVMPVASESIRICHSQSGGKGSYFWFCKQLLISYRSDLRVCW